VIRDLGVAEAKTAGQISDIKSRQESQEERLSSQEAEIRSLQVALQGIVTRYELDKLVGLDRDDPFLCYYSDDMMNELKRLRALNLVRNHEGVGLTAIRSAFTRTGNST
jgi:ribosomal protein L9